MACAQIKYLNEVVMNVMTTDLFFSFSIMYYYKFNTSNFIMIAGLLVCVVGLNPETQSCDKELIIKIIRDGLIEL